MTDFEALADRDGVTRREKRTEVGAERFADLREKAEPMTWAVGAVVTDDEGRVLLVREDGRWLAPGGEVEPGETHAEALVREVREETGVRVRVGDLLAVTDVAFVHGDERVGFHFAHYAATPETTTLTDDPGLAGEDIETVAWMAAVPPDTVDRDVIVANR